MTKEPVHWDPFHMDAADPYPMLARLREETPIYYNEAHDFYALSRYDDCEAGLSDRDTFSSAKGSVIDIIGARLRDHARYAELTGRFSAVNATSPEPVRWTP